MFSFRRVYFLIGIGPGQGVQKTGAIIFGGQLVKPLREQTVAAPAFSQRHGKGIVHGFGDFVRIVGIDDQRLIEIAGNAREIARG